MNLNDTQISRRSITKGAAWSIPTVAVASIAPSFAASGVKCVTSCVNSTIDWDKAAAGTATFTRTNTSPGQNTTVSYTLPVTNLKSGASSVKMNITTAYYGNMRSGVVNEINTGYSYSDNLKPMADGPWSFGTYALEFHQQVRDAYGNNVGTGSYNDRGEYTFTFSEPVCYLKFTIYDIDRRDYTTLSNGYNDFGDSVSISSASTWNYSKGSQIVGTGTSTDPFRSYYANNAQGNDTNYATTIEFPNGVKSFTIRYWDNLAANYGGYPTIEGDQAIYISDMITGTTVETCTTTNPTPTPTASCTVGSTYTIDWSTYNATTKTVTAKASNGSTIPVTLSNTMGGYTALTGNMTSTGTALKLAERPTSTSTVTQTSSDAQKINFSFGGATVTDVKVSMSGMNYNYDTTTGNYAWETVKVWGTTGTTTTWSGFTADAYNNGGTPTISSGTASSMTGVSIAYFDQYAKSNPSGITANIGTVSFVATKCPA